MAERTLSCARQAILKKTGQLKTLAHNFLSLIYPPICLHCSQMLPQGESNLCATCFLALDQLDPKFHCPFCFSPLESLHKKVCEKCRSKKQIRRAAVFDDSGPAQALHRGFVSHGQPYLTKGAAAYLALQWSSLEWEMPDVIVPVPIPKREALRKGYDYNVLLAKHLSELINTPLLTALSFDEWATPPFKVRRMLHDKVVLLVMDKIEENALFDFAGSALLEAFPKRIYGLAFVKYLPKSQ